MIRLPKPFSLRTRREEHREERAPLAARIDRTTNAIIMDISWCEGTKSATFAWVSGIDSYAETNQYVQNPSICRLKLDSIHLAQSRLNAYAPLASSPQTPRVVFYMDSIDSRQVVTKLGLICHQEFLCQRIRSLCAELLSTHNFELYEWIG